LAAKESTQVSEQEQKAIVVLSDREQRALRVVMKYMWWSMGAGLVPIPFLDLAAVSGVQLKMLADISKLYEVPFRESRGKAVIGSMISTIVPHSMSFGVFGTLLKAVPVVGAFAGAPSMVLFSGASTWALGNVFVQHFESGGTFLNFHPEEVREYFKTQYEEGKRIVTRKEKAESPA
jgi:uncharacterized protein (DUF697 family)